jgi:hypothetical protein
MDVRMYDRRKLSDIVLLFSVALETLYSFLYIIKIVMMPRDMTTKFADRWWHTWLYVALSVPVGGSASNCISVVSCHNFHEERFFRRDF